MVEEKAGVGKILSEIFREVILEKHTELTDRAFNAFLDAAITLNERVKTIPAYMAYELTEFDNPIKVVTAALKHYEIPEEVIAEIIEELKKRI